VPVVAPIGQPLAQLSLDPLHIESDELLGAVELRQFCERCVRRCSRSRTRQRLDVARDRNRSNEPGCSSSSVRISEWSAARFVSIASGAAAAPSARPRLRLGDRD
jgi:hypothetical protein